MKNLTILHFAKKSVMSRVAYTVRRVGRFLQSYNITVSQSHTIVEKYAIFFRGSRAIHTRIYSTYFGRNHCNFVSCPPRRAFGHAHEITAKCDLAVMYKPHGPSGRVRTRKTTGGTACLRAMISAQLLIIRFIGSNFRAAVTGGVGRSGSDLGWSGGSRAIPPQRASRRGGPSLWPRDEFRSDFRVPVGSRGHTWAYNINRQWVAWLLARRWFWRDLEVQPGNFCRRSMEGGGE